MIANKGNTILFFLLLQAQNIRIPVITARRDDRLEFLIEDDGHCLQNQSVLCRPVFDDPVWQAQFSLGCKAVVPLQQALLQLGFDQCPVRPQVPHIIIVRKLLALCTEPSIGGVEHLIRGQSWCLGAFPDLPSTENSAQKEKAQDQYEE